MLRISLRRFAQHDNVLMLTVVAPSGFADYLLAARFVTRVFY